jgi:alkylated DNA nucleotide flippase Atl1
MSRVPIPYQRSAAIPRVYQFLKRAAAQGRYVTYKRLAMLVGLPISGNYMAREVGLLCGEISDWMDDQGLPMLSAIVVRGDTQMPGKGFVTLAVSLGRLHNGTSLHVKRRFWERERTAVFTRRQWP